MVHKYTIFNYSPEMYEKDKTLMDKVHSRAPYLGRKHNDTLELAKILKEYGYKGLRVISNQEAYNKNQSPYMSLDRLVKIHPERIVAVMQSMYFDASKRTAVFGNPLDNPKSPFYVKSTYLHENVEGDGQIRLFS